MFFTFQIMGKPDYIDVAVDAFRKLVVDKKLENFLNDNAELEDQNIHETIPLLNTDIDSQVNIDNQIMDKSDNQANDNRTEDNDDESIKEDKKLAIEQLFDQDPEKNKVQDNDIVNHKVKRNNSKKNFVF